MTADLIKGLIELAGGAFILLNIRRVAKDREVRGASIVAMGYFLLNGLFNCWFFPHVGCWLAFAGNLGMMVANTVYFVLLLRFRR